jgi:hypothetical protein
LPAHQSWINPTLSQLTCVDEDNENDSTHASSQELSAPGGLSGSLSENQNHFPGRLISSMFFLYEAVFLV